MPQPRRRPLLSTPHWPDHAGDPGGAGAGGTAVAWRELYETCCLAGWESRGGVHDPRACPGRSAA
ncbi:hypothetical protein ACF1BS_02805 [Streptomyces sp. NPDC014748]|uniref:hypothetical protein n=1 Tax=unclassified Streptomyces TaxID=2593676 RepID=UPI000381B6A4|nr:hypothetical protein [Streptomyces sp. GMY02]NMO32842.1 hypothetical protein [Streptomyces sp. GMY02]